MAFPKRFKKTVLALLVLVIPGICYMLLRTGTNYYSSLPVFGPQGQIALSDSLPDSAWYKFDLSRFAAPDEGMENLENKMYVAGFLRAQAGSQAETLAVNMLRLSKTYQDLDRLAFVAFIATDTAVTDSSSGGTPVGELLQSYAAGGDQWLKLHMPEATVRKIMREGVLLEPDQHTGSGMPMSDTLVLIDSRRRIRGYYDGSSYFDTDTLKDEIAVLWKEEMNQDDQE